MARKRYALSARGLRKTRSQKPEVRGEKNRREESQIKRLPTRGLPKPKPDCRIDLSDIPESTDAELMRARRVGRPKSGQAKQLIAIRISPRLLAQLRRRAARLSKPYQTLIHELLEKAAARGA
jgi:predicted DNA binding CopG/RHH family protein